MSVTVADDFDGDMSTIHQEIPFLEAKGIKDVKPGSLYMTHMPFDASTFNPNAKYIIVLRNPRDVAVSFYHFSTQIAARFGGERPHQYSESLRQLRGLSISTIASV